MPVALDTTISGVASNSYVTLSEAQNIIDGLLSNANLAAWTAATTDNKNRFLVSATLRLDAERFIGWKAKPDQALQFPRREAPRPDYFSPSAEWYEEISYVYGSGYLGLEEIPLKIKQAQAVLAVYLAANTDGLDFSGLEDFSAVRVGPISLSLRDDISQLNPVRPLPPLVRGMLRGFIVPATQPQLMRS